MPSERPVETKQVPVVPALWLKLQTKNRFEPPSPSVKSVCEPSPVQTSILRVQGMMSTNISPNRRVPSGRFRRPISTIEYQSWGIHLVDGSRRPSFETCQRSEHIIMQVVPNQDLPQSGRGLMFRRSSRCLVLLFLTSDVGSSGLYTVASV